MRGRGRRQLPFDEAGSPSVRRRNDRSTPPRTVPASSQPKTKRAPVCQSSISATAVRSVTALLEGSVGKDAGRDPKLRRSTKPFIIPGVYRGVSGFWRPCPAAESVRRSPVPTARNHPCGRVPPTPDRTTAAATRFDPGPPDPATFPSADGPMPTSGRTRPSHECRRETTRIHPRADR